MTVPTSPQDAFVHGKLINLVRTGHAVTRPALEQETGLGRKVVAQRVQQAIDARLLEDGEFAPSGGGRPSRVLRFRAEAGHVFAAGVAPGEVTTAVSTLDGSLLAVDHADWDVANRPDETIALVDRMFRKLARRTGAQPWGIGVGIAGPVDFSTGRLVAPLVMPGWDGYSVRGALREYYDAPVWVDNDVNCMALGEWYRGEPRDGRDLLYVLLDTGIGAGLVSRGTVFRGDTGAAGDIGHAPVYDRNDVLCRCGRRGCLEAVVGGWGVVQALTPRAHESAILSAALAEHGRLTPEDVGRAAAAGDAIATEASHLSSVALGQAVANFVNFANPGTVVLGGGALRYSNQVFDVFDRAVLSGTTELARRRLTIRPASLDFREGVIGAAIMAIEYLFGPSAVGLWVEDGSPLGHAVMLQRSAV